MVKTGLAADISNLLPGLAVPMPTLMLLSVYRVVFVRRILSALPDKNEKPPELVPVELRLIRLFAASAWIASKALSVPAALYC